MTILNPNRKTTALGDGASGQVFTLGFAIEEKEHLSIYEEEKLCYLDEHYTVTTYGIPEEVSDVEETVVTWIDKTKNGATYTFLRTTPRTQPEVIEPGLGDNSVERGVNRLAMQCQESLFATFEVFDADGSRIQCLGAPVKDEEAAHYLYAQAQFSKSGYIAPPITGSDEGKLFYSVDESTVGWKSPFDFPDASDVDDIMRVQRDGSMDWETPPTYTPTLPSTAQFLSVDDDGSTIEWRQISDLPDPTNEPERQCITCQEGGTVAWEEVMDVPQHPTFDPPYHYTITRKYVLQIWTGRMTGEHLATTQTFPIPKAVYIDAQNPTTNYGSHSKLRINALSVNKKRTIVELDVDSLETDPQKIAKVYLVLNRTAVANNNSNTRTAIIGRLTQDFVEDEVTWNEASSGVAWSGGAGADNDVDYTTHCMPLELEGLVGGGSGEQRYDITYLYLDAIKNRNNNLRLLLFVKNVGSPSVYNNFHSDDASNTSKRPYIEIHKTQAVKRTAKWMGVAWGETPNYPIFWQNRQQYVEETTDIDGYPDDAMWAMWHPHFSHYNWPITIPHVVDVDVSEKGLGLATFLQKSTTEGDGYVASNEGYTSWQCYGDLRRKVMPMQIHGAFHDSTFPVFSVGQNPYALKASFFVWSNSDLYSDTLGDLDGTGCG